MSLFKKALASAAAFSLIAVPVAAVAAPAPSVSAVAPVGPSVKAKSKLAPLLIGLIAIFFVGGIVLIADSGRSNSPG